MLEYKIKKGPFSSHIKWFSPRPSLQEAFGFYEYRQTLYQKPLLGFQCENFYTIHIDLSNTEESLLTNCSKSTRYKIKRARREGMQFTLSNDIEQFVKFYNKFASTKNMAPISNIDLERVQNHLHITQAIYENEILAMHTYFFDKEIKRACLYHTASLFRNVDDSSTRQLIGRANRFLHFEDMLYFKSLGAKQYDLGGYAVDDSNEERQQINEFKKGFGGEIVKEPNYMSYPLYLYFLLKFKK
jgi:lipid II:glycine glycyltransferase (peptidoglycan interpeptide bridge formation enzyme)